MNRTDTRAVTAARDERGSAVVEFIYLGVLLLIPLIYLVLTVGRLQAASYAASAAVRESARAFITADTSAQAPLRAEAAAALAFEDQGFARGGSLRVECAATPCLTPGSRIQSTVVISVPLPLIPQFARKAVPLAIPVTARHIATVDRFRSAR